MSSLCAHHEVRCSAGDENNVIVGNVSYGYSCTGGGVSLGPDCTILNNTFVSNGTRYGSGAVYVGARSLIADNIFEGNQTLEGGGGAIETSDESVVICRNFFVNNRSGSESSGYGGAFYGSATVHNNLFVGNSAAGFNEGYGGAAYLTGGTFVNNTLVANIGDPRGGASGLYVASEATVANNIIVDGISGVGLYVGADATVTSDYNNIWDNDLGAYGGSAAPGAHDSHADPLFASGDYHLMSDTGRWDPNTGTWVTDAVHSPCINAGDPSSDYPNEPAPNGSRINMGAYGNTTEASKGSNVPGDEPVTPDEPYVSVEGSDATGDGTSENPWRTIQYAVNHIWENGATVHVMPGTYTEQVVVQPIAAGLRLLGSGADVTTIDASGIYRNGGVIKLTEGHGYVISGFTLTGGSYEGSGGPGGAIRGTDNSTGIESSVSARVENNVIVDNYSWGYDYVGGAISLGPDCIIRNNVLRDNASEYGSGAVYVGARSVIADNVFQENASHDGEGGAIRTFDESVVICGNVFLNNRAESSYSGQGGAFYGSATVHNNLFVGNSAAGYTGHMKGSGGAAYLVGGTFVNNTLVGNMADPRGAASGVYVAFSVWPGPTSTPVTIANNIIATGNGGVGLHVAAGATVTSDYNNIWDNVGTYGGDATPGAHDIYMDPHFANLAAGDFHLKSTIGRWDPSTETWVTDAVDSPCIDAGDRSSDYSNEPVPNGWRINMGAYGNTAEASKSLSPPATPTDLTATLAGPTPVDLNWTDNADNEDGFTLQCRKYDSTEGWPATWTTLASLPEDTEEYTDDTIAEDGHYQYRVRAFSAVGRSNWSRPARIIVTSTRPPTPSNFAAELVDDNTARLTWTDNSDINRGFTLQRRQWDTGTGWPAAWTTRRWLGPSVETYDDALAEDGIYQYRLRAYNSVGPGNWARPRYVSRATAKPDAPTDLTLTAVDSTIIADWTVNATNAQGYTLQKRKRNPDGTWPDFDRPAKWLGPTVQSFTDTNLSANGTYQYRVRAYNSEGPSSWAPYERIAYVAGAGMPGVLCSVAVTQANGQFVNIVYGLSSDADVAIEVRNIAGRLVRAIPCGTASAGLNTATWNLRNRAGAPVPSGMYLCAITARTADGTQATAVRTVSVRR